MDQAHLHLMLTHFPIAGVVIGLMVLIGGYFTSNTMVKRTALGVFIISALFAIPSFLTGEGAEEIVENLPGVMESYIEEHEEAAEIYIWLISILGVLSVVTLYLDTIKPATAKLFYLILVALALTTMAAAYRLGNYGGQIRHTELRENTNAAVFQQNQKTVENEDHE